MKKLAAVVAAVSLVGLSTLAYGAPPDHGMGPRPQMSCGCGMDGPMMGDEHCMVKHLGELNLDEQQKAAIAEIKSKTMKETITKTAEMHIVQIELHDLLNMDPVDMKAVEEKVKGLATMTGEMHLAHIKAMEECKAKMTPEQRAKLKEIVAAEPVKEGNRKQDRPNKKKR
jgi:Spy/CpxP family protein refolding chaperone